jgi:hypothetical protein
MKLITHNKRGAIRFKLSVIRYTFRARGGQLSLQVLILGAIATVMLSGVVLWANAYVNEIARDRQKATAFAIAEAGVEYYRWHLSHAPTDFYDGQGSSSTGPYIHPYFDKNGAQVGQFELAITPPATGTTIVTVEATGRVSYATSTPKIIRSRLGVPFIGQYAVVSNGNIRFSSTTEVYGLVHSNGGISFDGIAYNLVTSARATYNDPDHSGGDEFGVHTHVPPVDPLPPATVPVRNDVFVAGRTFPVPAIDFTAFTRSLSSIKTKAQQNGYYRGGSGAKGYDVVLKTDGTFDLYKVTAITPITKECKGSNKFASTWTIQTEQIASSSVAFPDNGLFFLEDNVWVRGQINNRRITLAAAKFPAKPNRYANIIVNNDLTYTNFDGRDVIGLIAQGDVKVGLESEDDLVIDAALVAQNGKAAKEHYSSKCGEAYIRSRLSLYGMIATKNKYGFAYTDGTGYQTRVITYDGNLLYAPPPEFPIIGNQYQVISWEEVK